MKIDKQSSLGAFLLGALFLTTGLAGSGATEDASGTPISRLAPGHANREIGVPTTLDTADNPAAKSSIAAAYGQLPLAFEPNQGQSDPQVKFLCRGSGYSLFLTETESVLVLHAPEPGKAPSRIGNTAVTHPVHSSHGAAPPLSGEQEVLRFKLLGANAHPGFEGVEPLPGRSNYFIGNDPKKWRKNIPQYARVASAQVYPGIDLVYYGRQHRLEYDFQVAPGVDPRAIRFAVEGARKVDLDAQGNLLLHTSGGDVIEQAPVIYQDIDGKRQAVAGSFELHRPDKSEMSVGFRVTAYDRSKPLIIDPTLVYSTYLGGSGAEGSGDQGKGIAVDGDGNAYVTGEAFSTNFPATAGAFQKTNTGAANVYGNVFVTKLGPAGAALVYSTYLGGAGIGFNEGNDGDEGDGIAVDSSGNAYVTGFTYSTDFPTTAGAFQKTNKADGDFTAFVTKLGPAGAALIYSTYLGGSGEDSGDGIAVDSSRNAYVTGFTYSSDFPTTAGAFQKTAGTAFVTKLGPAGAALVYSTRLGGSEIDQGNAIAVDSSGNAYVTGFADSKDFPTTTGAFQTTSNGVAGSGSAFVTKVGPGGAKLVYSTYLGGSGFDIFGNITGDLGKGIAVDSSGNAYVTGVAGSTDFPTTTDAFQKTNKAAGNEAGNAFVTKLGPAGAAVVYSTYLGGSGNPDQQGDLGASIAVDSSGHAYVTGQTNSTNFPTTAGAFQTTNKSNYGNAFVTKLGPAGAAVVYSTYLGGSGNVNGNVAGDQGNGIAVDSSGNAYVTGYAASTNFPTTANAFQKTNKAAGNQATNAFVTKINTE